MPAEELPISQCAKNPSEYKPVAKTNGSVSLPLGHNPLEHVLLLPADATFRSTSFGVSKLHPWSEGGNILMVLSVLIGKSDDMQPHELFQRFEIGFKILPLALRSPNRQRLEIDGLQIRNDLRRGKGRRTVLDGQHRAVEGFSTRLNLR